MPKSKPKNTPKINPFKIAVENTVDIADDYQVGLKGLGAYSTKIELADTRLCEGSINIDDALQELYPQSNRWDYALSYESKVYFVEVHAAKTGEMDTMFKKLEWLKDWLRNNAPEIQQLSAEKPFHWVAVNGVHILKQSAQYKQLTLKGFLPISKLKLPIV